MTFRLSVLAIALLIPSATFAEGYSIETKSAIEFGSLSKIQRAVLKSFMTIHNVEVCQKMRGARGAYTWNTATIEDVHRAVETGAPDSYRFIGRSDLMGGGSMLTNRKWTTEGAAWLGQSCIVSKVKGAGTNTWAYTDDFEIWATESGIQTWGSVTAKGFAEGYDQFSGGVPWVMSWADAIKFVNSYVDKQDKGKF